MLLAEAHELSGKAVHGSEEVCASPGHQSSLSQVKRIKDVLCLFYLLLLGPTLCIDALEERCH